MESLEFSDLPDNFDLGKLKIPNIKNLKVSSSSSDSVKMPFCLLNDLDSLILSYFKLDIYSIPNGSDTFELKKLKYLKLVNTKVIKELNIKLSTPNLIILYFEFFPYEEKKSFFAYYFDLFEEENEKSITDTDSFNDYKFTVPQNIIKRFYDKYINLKHFFLFRFDDSTSQMMYEKIVQGIKSKDDLVECFYTYRDSEIPINTCESFFYDLKKQKINYYDEIHVSSFFSINDSSIPLLLDDIEDDNYSLQVIQISDLYNNKGYMKND